MNLYFYEVIIVLQGMTENKCQWTNETVKSVFDKLFVNGMTMSNKRFNLGYISLKR